MDGLVGGLMGGLVGNKGCRGMLVACCAVELCRAVLC